MTMYIIPDLLIIPFDAQTGQKASHESQSNHNARLAQKTHSNAGIIIFDSSSETQTNFQASHASRHVTQMSVIMVAIYMML